ncbi:hypothetical protein AGMMS50256_03020 [Betaproteobacteria bacterium]|nr:hypothetical protein AGMMS50256_03020 [Betaproteobacteria bacterium]
MNMNITARKPHYCLQCDDGAELELGVRDVTLHADDVTRVVPEVAGWHCSKCGEIEFVDQDSARRMSAAWGGAWAEVYGGALRRENTFLDSRLRGNDAY